MSMFWLAIVIGVVLGFINLLLPRSDKLLNSNNMDQNLGLLQEGHFIAAGLGFLLPMAFFAVIAFFVLSVIHMVFLSPLGVAGWIEAADVKKQKIG